jgi:hypothetical protein
MPLLFLTRTQLPLCKFLLSHIMYTTNALKSWHYVGSSVFLLHGSNIYGLILTERTRLHELKNIIITKRKMNILSWMGVEFYNMSSSAIDVRKLLIDFEPWLMV